MTGHDPYINAGVAEATEELRRKTANARRVTFEQDLTWVMSGPRGRRLINWIAIELAGLHAECHRPTDEGSRRVGIELHNMLEAHCLEEYFAMRQEALSPDE